jgi:hypothetical protein
MCHCVHARILQAIIVVARVPEKIRYVLAEVRVLHELVQLLQCFRTVGNYRNLDEVWRADGMQILTHKTVGCDSTATLCREKTEDAFVQLRGQIAERRLESEVGTISQVIKLLDNYSY